ncbi:MAG: class III poly(R)-hydroxyalkanoic acid synthase subunit PhaC [Algiphilus sp.]
MTGFSMPNMPNMPVAIDPQKAMQEMANWQMKFGALQANLRGLQDETNGVTARECVFQQDKVRLYRYAGEGNRKSPPILICYALVNRPHMMDIEAEKSLIRSLTKRGHDIYLIDWGYPDPADRVLSLGDFIFGYIDDCVDEVRRLTRSDAVNLLGVCQGGCFSLCYAAANPEKVANLTVMVTPVDFQTPDNLLTKWAMHADVDQAVQAFGNIPGDVLNVSYVSLKPFQLNVQKYLTLLDIGDDPEAVRSFMRMEQWIFDSPDQAGACYGEFTRKFHQENQLVQDELSIEGVQIRLDRLTMPVLNIYARDDHLVPPAASKALASKVGTEDYQELEFPGGHIGIYVSGKSQKLVSPAISDWLIARN